MIATARGDGTDSQFVLFYGAWLGGPAFSPDGARIAFVRAEGPVCSLLTVPSVGGVQTNLARSPSCSPPAWSPDGSSIADLVLDPATNSLAVRLIEPTSGQTLETIPAAVPMSRSRDISLAWSPDGTRIAIAGKGGIYLVPVVPLAAAQLAIPIPDAAHPSFSPDGSQIAFDAPVAATGKQAAATPQTAVMVANSDGSNAHILSTVPQRQSGYPAWQPVP